MVKKPVPAPDADSAALWRGLRRRHAAAAALRRLRPRAILTSRRCAGSGGENLAHRPASGRGKYIPSAWCSAPGTRFQHRSALRCLCLDRSGGGPADDRHYAAASPKRSRTFDMEVMLVCEKINEEVTLPRVRQAIPDEASSHIRNTPDLVGLAGVRPARSSNSAMLPLRSSPRVRSPYRTGKWRA